MNWEVFFSSFFNFFWFWRLSIYACLKEEKLQKATDLYFQPVQVARVLLKESTPYGFGYFWGSLYVYLCVAGHLLKVWAMTLNEDDHVNLLHRIIVLVPTEYLCPLTSKWVRIGTDSSGLMLFYYFLDGYDWSCNFDNYLIFFLLCKLVSLKIYLVRISVYLKNN